MKNLFYFLLLAACSKSDEPQGELSQSSSSSATEQKEIVKMTAEQVIRGTVGIIPDLQKYLLKDQSLFIMIRDYQSEQTLALKKYALHALPLEYEISSNDSILPNTKFEGPFRIMAKIDKDGILSAPESGDMWGTYPGNPVYLGATGINITIDTLQP